MIFISLVALIAFALAAVSGTFSIIGLSSTFPSIYWSVIAMGVVLYAGMLASASIVYRYWGILSKRITVPLAIFTLVLASISMAGHFGYLSKGYQVDSLGMKKIEAQISSLQAEEDRKIARKVEIDTQIANLPSDRAQSRIRLVNTFQDEQKTVTDRINALDTQITELKTQEIEFQSHAGPITYIASALGVKTDDSVKWLILMIVSVFEPLALWLTVSISAMLKHRERLKDEAEIEIDDSSKIKKPRKQKEKDTPLNIFELAEEAEKEKNIKHERVPFDVRIKDPFNHKI